MHFFSSIFFLLLNYFCPSFNLVSYHFSTVQCPNPLFLYERQKFKHEGFKPLSESSCNSIVLVVSTVKGLAGSCLPSKVRAQVSKILIVYLWPFYFIILNCLVKCSPILHRCSDAHEFLCTRNIFNHFLLLRFLKLQYQMEGGKKSSAIIYTTSVSCPVIKVSAHVSKGCPNKTWDFRRI